jgi:multidrug efflux pump subunit AcrA (membrane-fusion protein)
MLRKRSKKVLYISSITVGITFLLILLEVSVPNSIYTYFEVHPKQKWILARGTEGQIVSNIIDYTSMVSNNFSVIQFERGESMNFQLLPSLSEKSSVVKGDTIGRINSTRLQENIAELEGDLLIARANLTAKSAGEKQALIDEAKNKVKYSDAKIQEQTTLFQRAEELFKKEYISQSEYEIASWNLRQCQIQNDIDKATLAALTSGSKDEELQVLKSTINSYSAELELQKKRLSNFVLTAPISGEILREYSRDTIISVSNTSALVLTAPLRYEQMKYVTEGRAVTVKLNLVSGEISGQLLSVSKEIKNLNGVQVSYCRILLDSPPPNLLPGLLIQGKILLPNLTIREYLISLFDN